MTRQSIDTLQVRHVTLEVGAGYEAFTSRLEQLLGRFDPAVADTFATAPQLADHRLKAMEGEQNLMIFQILDHGGLFRLVGQDRKARRYTVGNPRIAIQMTPNDIRAALYVPFNLLVHEIEPGRLRVEFDQPSSLLNYGDCSAVTEVAVSLDGKIEKLIERAAAVPSH